MTDRADWLPVVGSLEYDTMAEAIEALKSIGDGKWKWHKPSGNGKRHAYFVCNAHKKCGFLRRAVRMDGMFILHECGEHGEEVNLFQRKNSALTFAQDADLRKAMDMGARPGKVMVSWTKEKSAELKKAGLNPLDHKKEGGGLIGAQTPADTQRAHVSHV